MSSAMRWWRDAGVDVMIDEKPRNWLAAAVAAPDRPPVVVTTRVEKPKSLETLVDWLMTSNNVPEIGPVARRVRPAGNASSGLMVLTGVPEIADVESGLYFAGALSPLFEKMLGSLGRDRDTIYLASVSPGRPPSGRLSDAAVKSLSELARDHVRFVAPQQLWVVGSAASCAILGMTDVQASGSLQTVNLDGVMVDVIATAHPRILDTREKKKRAWDSMKLLVEKDVL
ncbi:uracil-DNA glycosylase family protein [Sphingomonas sp.]|uniref:uracil-DNA glycosylase family protein n=1 Tax=Sphingomonas sp. TaxID=28214 RepID=UPI0025FAAE65|nr:uracil-DNA glycosylase family protein [Sphingomonas sp.]